MLLASEGCTIEVIEVDEDAAEVLGNPLWGPVFGVGKVPRCEEM